MDENKLDQLLEGYEQESTAVDTGTGNRVYQVVTERMMDRVLGYAISSSAALFALVFMVPRFLATWNRMYLESGLDPGMLTVLENAWGTGGFFPVFLVLGFFIGGWALNRAQKWGGSLIQFCIWLWGYIILFEIRYWAGSTVWSWSVFLSTLLGFSAMLYGIRRVIRNRDLQSVRLLQGLAILTTVVNLSMILRFFIPFNMPGMVADRHVVYLILVFFAAMTQQAVTCGGELLPYWSKLTMFRRN